MKAPLRHLFDLRRFLGERVVYIRCTGKQPNGKWGQLTVADMTSQYLASLKTGNIGVALGSVSGGVCAIDFDDDDFVQPFLTLNPDFSNTFRTHGARGCALWIRLRGSCPPSFKLQTESGEAVGEFRSKGNQSIVWGTHPDTKKPYQWVIRQPAIEVEFDSIRWPDGVKLPSCIEDKEELEVPEGLEVQEEVGGDASRSSSSGASAASDPSASSSPSCSSIYEGWSTQIRDAEDVLRRCVPTNAHNNNRLLFDLARGAKALELLGGESLAPEELRDLFGQWHSRSARFLRPEQSKEEYWIEFLNACASAKYPLGGVAILKAWENAKANPLPQEAEQFENKELRLVVALCRELQVVNGDKPFYLSCYTCQKLLGHKSHSTAAKWLRSLRVLKIIELVEQGNTHRASRYRYSSVCAGE